MLYLSAKVILLLAFRYFFIIYFYICSVNTDSAKDMQTLLEDIELDIQELKCLVQAVSSDANPALRVVVKRNIQQMKTRLDALSKLLDEAPETLKAPVALELPVSPAPSPEPVLPAEAVLPSEPAHVEPAPAEPVRPVEAVVVNTTKVIYEHSAAGTVDSVQTQSVVTSASAILAERIKPATDLRHAISLNDSFRFVRELFGGDASRMNDMLGRLSAAPSLDKAVDIFVSEVHPDEENESATDFIELLKKYFS